MSENLNKDVPTIEELRARIEREKLELTSSCIHATQDFFGFDKNFNVKILEVFDVVIAAAKSAPPETFRSSSGNLDELINVLTKKREESGSGGLTGGDIVGGADWIDDLDRIVKALSSVVKEEKDFFLQIIKLIFCGCK